MAPDANRITLLAHIAECNERHANIKQRLTRIELILLASTGFVIKLLLDLQKVV